MFEKWIALGLSKGITDLEIFAVQNKSLKLSVYQGKLDQHVQSNIESVSIRGIYDNKLSTVRFENLSDETASYMLNQLIENAKALTVVEPAIIYEGSKEYPVVSDELFDFGSVLVTKKIELLKSLEKKILSNPLASQVQTTLYQEVDTKISLVNSKGLNLTRRNTYAYAYAVAVFGKDDDIVTSYDVKLAKRFDEFNALDMAEVTIDKGIKKLGGSSIPSGEYPVVFSNEMFSDIIDVFSSIFSGEAAYRKLTQLKDKVNQQIAGKEINIIDDPLSDLAYFKNPFDDEGVACKKRYVVENGVFKGFNHNLKTAKIFNEEPTGNGFGGGISSTNLYLEPGNIDFNQLIKPIEKGIYITELIGLHAGVKTVSGAFNLQASGMMIENGKLTKAVKMIVVSGNFFEMMNKVSGIASDLKFNTSGTGSPSVHIESLMIGGE
ncbi:MAG: TldD/PmbA family protein [Acholeplasmataceae bacterium]|nr:TldD/PmbA family protein [Acholeplasmataceae bacterium]